MSERLHLHVILHGAIILAVGLLCGIPFGFVAARGAGEDAARAWALCREHCREHRCAEGDAGLGAA